MTTLREAAQQALEALETYATHRPLPGPCPVRDVEYALRAALAEPVREQVQEHEDWCASVTQLLLCDPPRKAPCNCKKKVAEPMQEPEARQTMTPKELAASLKRGEKWTLAEPVIESVSKAQA